MSLEKARTSIISLLKSLRLSGGGGASWENSGNEGSSGSGTSSSSSFEIADSFEGTSSKCVDYIESLKSLGIEGIYYVKVVDDSEHYCRYLASALKTVVGKGIYIALDLSDATKLYTNGSEGTSRAFEDCTALIAVSFPLTETTIGKYFFKGCTSLVYVEIPSNITTIKEGAFYGCTALESISGSDGVTSIGSFVFYKCSSLEYFKIPSGVTSLSSNIFESCSSLKSIEWSEKLEKIGGDAFVYCTSLESISIPSTVCYIGKSAFIGCSSLESVVLNSSTWYVTYNADDDKPVKLSELGVDTTDSAEVAYCLRKTYGEYIWTTSSFIY